MRQERRIAGITGMGICSCIGIGLNKVAQNLANGQSGLSYSDLREANGYQSSLMGFVAYSPPEDAARWKELIKKYHVSQAVRKAMSDQAIWAALAVGEAVEQAKLTDVDLSSSALIVSSDSAIAETVQIGDIMSEVNDTRALGGYSVFKTLNSNVSMTLSQFFHIRGLTLSVSAACAGGGHAVGLAKTLIESGVVDRCIVVGAQEDDVVSSWAFDSLGIFSQSDDPVHASRPFDEKHDGLVPSGGAAAIVMERCSPPMFLHDRIALYTYRPKIAEAIPALAVVSGYGYSTSNSIIKPDDASYVHTMCAACNDADMLFSDIDMVMAHATGTVEGDEAEAKAITCMCDTFIGGKHAEKEVYARPYVVATKCLTGHECWMSGVSQVVYTIMQMRGAFVSPNINLENPIPAARHLNIPRTPQSAKITTALLNNFGFGGTNASLVIEKAL